MAREEETATAVEVTRGSKGIRLVVMRVPLARLPTRRELARTALGIIFCSAMLTTLSLLFFLR